MQNLDRARKELEEQLSKTDTALKDDNSQQAGQLRTAMGQVRDAMGGDPAKIESARKALEKVGSSQ